jgi:hypothetical protein
VDEPLVGFLESGFEAIEEAHGIWLVGLRG